MARAWDFVIPWMTFSPPPLPATNYLDRIESCLASDGWICDKFICSEFSISGGMSWEDLLRVGLEIIMV